MIISLPTVKIRRDKWCTFRRVCVRPRNEATSLHGVPQRKALQEYFNILYWYFLFKR